MPAQALRRARVAVAAAFFVNGAAFAGWVPRIPDAAATLGLDPPALGLALAGTGVGALLGSVLAAPLIASRGSRLVTVGAGTALCAAVVLPALAGSWLALTGALLLVGVADAVMDVAMNANAVAVERRSKRTVLNSMHAVWSVGALTGALTGSAAVGLDIGPGAHLATAAACCSSRSGPAPPSCCVQTAARRRSPAEQGCPGPPRRWGPWGRWRCARRWSRVPPPTGAPCTWPHRRAPRPVASPSPPSAPP